MTTALDSFVSFLNSEGAILDVGCGAGDDTRDISARGFEAVGIDIDEEKIRGARSNLDRCIFRQMDARFLQYPPASFDGIWADTLLDHVPAAERDQTVAGFSDILKPGAPLYLNLESGASHIDLLKKNGLEIVSRLKFPNRTSDRVVDRRVEIIAVRAENPDPQHERFEDNCFLCPNIRFSLNRQASLPGAGSLLWGNKHFYLIPDIAPIIEGHLLLITTKHYMCYGACPAEVNPEIVSMQQSIRALFAEIYQAPTIFMEHGPAHTKRAGVCIEHAHLHCIPAALPIKESIEKLLGGGKDASLEKLQQMYQAGQSYIYVEEKPDEGRAYIADVLPSQYLRQLTLSLLNRRDWEWQTTFKRPETQESFRRTLTRLIPAIDRTF